MFPAEIPHLKVRVSPVALANSMIGTQSGAIQRRIDQSVADCFPDKEGIVVKTPEGQLTLFTVGGELFAGNLHPTSIHIEDRGGLDAAPVAEWLQLVDKGMFN